jgi:hypothetical protein
VAGAAVTPDAVFSDVPPGHWAEGPVSRAANQLKIIKGYPDGTFRGGEKVSRYETITYLNNLSLSMEALLEQRLQAAGLTAPTGSISAESFLALRQELDDLKSEVKALQGRPPDDTALAGLLQDSFKLDIYAPSRKVSEQHDYKALALPSVFARVDLKLGRQSGLQGWEARVQDNSASFAAWAGKRFFPDGWVKFSGSLGPGQTVSAVDRQVREQPANALGGELSLWGLGLELEQVFVGDNIETGYDLDNDGSNERRRIDKTAARAQYTIPVAIPLLQTGTLEYAVENYYTAPEPGYAHDLRTMRYLTGLRFAIDEQKSLAIRAFKEAGDFYEIDAGEYRSRKKYSRYYEALLALGDLLQTGTEISLMYAQQGAGFGSNRLGENVPGVNLLGYASCGYLQNDLDGANRMPSADIITETGLKLTQDLYRGVFLLDLIYIQGSGLPDAAFSGADNKYSYAHYGVRLNWLLRQDTLCYLAHEQLELTDTAVEHKQEQFWSVVNKFGLRFTF